MVNQREQVLDKGFAALVLVAVNSPGALLILAACLFCLIIVMLEIENDHKTDK
jgi:hypothetical protein